MPGRIPPSGSERMDFPRYVIVEGPIGVGKTTLVERLAARRNARKLLEIFEENPFLPKFYHDRPRYAFQTEMFFLLSRYRQQTDLAQEDLFARHTFSDYLFVKTRLFASLTLSDDELTLYDRVYNILEPQVAKPDLVIYLHTSVDVLLERIKRRGRSMEKTIEAAYLEDLSRIYANFFRDYDDSPLLVVDAGAFNFADDASTVDRLIDAIRHMTERRSYLEGPAFGP